jgi:hypothetical protein
MGGGGHTTTHHETKTPNDYNDAWIRSKFDTIDERYTDFSNWRSGREAQLGYEGRQRDANAALLAQLQGDYRGLSSDVEGLGSRQDALRGDFRGLGETTTSRFADLTDAQRQQFKDIYNLQGGPGVQGAKTQKGLTPQQRRGGGSYGSFNRGGMQISGLNV